MSDITIRRSVVPAKSFAQFLAERGIPDPGLEHGFLRATACMSRAALKRAQARIAAEYPAVFAAIDEYYDLRASGAIPDVVVERPINPESEADQAYVRAQERRRKAREAQQS
jgi:hypothetical protein